jgi:hypothetical protein
VLTSFTLQTLSLLSPLRFTTAFPRYLQNRANRKEPATFSVTRRTPPATIAKSRSASVLVTIQSSNRSRPANKATQTYTLLRQGARRSRPLNNRLHRPLQPQAVHSSQAHAAARIHCWALLRRPVPARALIGAIQQVAIRQPSAQVLGICRSRLEYLDRVVYRR